MRRFLKTLESEIGYEEKASPADLDSKTENAGRKNYTKYARDLNQHGLMGCQGQPWCCTFISWAYITTYGLDKGLAMIGQSRSDYAGYNVFKTMERMDRDSIPHLGDLVIFKFSHIGAVVDIQGDRIKTIEGNTSGRHYDRNGGEVREKWYNKNDRNILCFCHPKYPANFKLRPARYHDPEQAGEYEVITAAANMRLGAGTDNQIIAQLQRGERVRCYGYYNIAGTRNWYLVKSKKGTGYMSGKVIKKCR